jgi:hypothetical protein
MICWLDTDTKKLHHIVNDKAKLEKFYDYYKNTIMVGYNSRNYDQWILKAILCDFNAYDMNDWIINQNQKGFMFSKLLNKFPVLNYDCSVGFRSLKELEAFMGNDIRESTVPFNIDRPLTDAELIETIKYCKHDVMQTFEVFVETKTEFESHIALIQEFELPLSNINKTKAQLSAIILGATQVKRNDEFDISVPDTLVLGNYDWIKDWYFEWAKESHDYETMKLTTDINGIPHTCGIGGLHGSKDKYMGDGYFLMADVGSYYPTLMIEYNFLSRNVRTPTKYRRIRDDRMKLKADKNPREYPRKIVLNATFGASKDKYNGLYDPLQSNNTCIAGQLLLLDLIDKLDGKCELIQSNTDGVLLKLFDKNDKSKIVTICDEWCKRTRMTMEFDNITRVIQKDVNSYIIVKDDGSIKRKGGYVKKLSPLDNDLPIVNRAVVQYLLNGTSVEKTVMDSNLMIDFQKITKITGKYEYGSHNGEIIYDKVHRCFASTDGADGTLYKKKKDKTTLDKTASTPINCFIYNDDINGMKIPSTVDKQWYIDIANARIKEFLGR